MALKKVFWILAVVLIVSLLGACVRSASTPPADVITPPPQEPEQVNPPTPTNEVLDQLSLFVTQTASAAQEQGMEATPGAPEGEPGSSEPTQPGEEVLPTQPGEEIQPTQPGQEVLPTQPEQVIQPTATTEVVAPVEPTAVPPTLVPTEPGAPPVVPTQIVVPTPTPGRPSTYQLQSGEFPYCIARRFDVNISQLLAMNGLGPSTILRSGTVLKIPQSGSYQGNRALNPHPTTYTVKAGQNIYEVACYFGDVSPDAIAFANNLQPPYKLTAGQTLNIP